MLRLRHSIVAGVAVVAALTALTAGQATPGVARAAGMAIPPSANQLIVVSSPTDDPPDYLATLRVYERANRTSPWRLVFGPWQAETGSAICCPPAPGGRATTRPRSGCSASAARCTETSRIPAAFTTPTTAWGAATGGTNTRIAAVQPVVHGPCGVTPSFSSWSEPLWTETVAYPYFAVIRFNVNPTRGGANALGSGIFLHSWVGGATEGCVALRESQLLDVLRWLKPSAHPVIEIGTEGQVRAPAARSDRPLVSTSTPASTRYVDVSVATVWASPSAPRTIDRPALGNPVNIGAWSRVLLTTARLGLDGKIETQALFGEPVRIVAQRGSWTRVAVVDQPAPIDRVGYPGWVPTRQLIAGVNFGGFVTGQRGG